MAAIAQERCLDFTDLVAIVAVGGIKLGDTPAPLVLVAFIVIPAIVVVSTVRRIRKGR